MNQLVSESYAERIHRLALGLEPLEAVRDGRLTHPVWVDIEGPLPWIPGWQRNTPPNYRQFVRPGSPRAVAARHNSCLHAILYQPGVAEQIDLRIYEQNRRYVPRRFRAPIVSLELLLAAEEAGGSLPHQDRVRRPILFPGAAHDVSSQATGLRGRVLRDGQPLRWARIEAFLDLPAAPLLARAHGDDRGEFLLLLPPQASAVSVLVDPINVRVSVHGPEIPPVPASTELPGLDSHWDLPLEELPPAGDPDLVSPGAQLPDGYVEGANRVIGVQLGKIISGLDVGDFNFVFP